MRMQEPRDAVWSLQLDIKCSRVKRIQQVHGSPLYFAIEKTELLLNNETAGSTEGQSDASNRTGAWPSIFAQQGQF